MNNWELAKILSEISFLLEMEGEAFKPRAYEKAASAIETLDTPVKEIYQKQGLKGLEAIPGVGVSIAEKIEELLKTGRLRYYEQIKKKYPIDIEHLSKIEGVGPKSLKKLYEKLKIKTIADLEKAAREGNIRKIEGFSEKAEENILRSIEFFKQGGNRFILGFIYPEIEALINELKKLKWVKKIVAAGSVRRMKETIGDLDILVASDNPKPVMDFFVNLPNVFQVVAHGETKSAIRLNNGLDVDLRVVPKESFGVALNYFTGSKNHGVHLREMALKKGYKLNEYGLFEVSKGKETRIAGATEEEIYQKLGLDYIEPEMREDWGEIELAQKHQLPKLIGYNDLKGDLQIQTHWSDGANSIEEYIGAALNLGLEYIAITDHTKTLAMTGGCDEKKLLKQIKEIDSIKQKLEKEGVKFKVLKSAEVNILKDGTLDIEESVLAKLDIVAAAVHSHFNMNQKEMTERICRAIKNPYVDIIFHPTGRVLLRRPPYEIDIEKIIAEAAKTGTCLEINASPDRLDLKDEHIKKAIEKGVKLSIDSDAHSITHLNYLKFGIAQARRGWASKNDVINTYPWPEMLKLLQKRKKRR